MGRRRIAQNAYQEDDNDTSRQTVSTIRAFSSLGLLSRSRIKPPFSMLERLKICVVGDTGAGKTTFIK